MSRFQIREVRFFFELTPVPVRYDLFKLRKEKKIGGDSFEEEDNGGFLSKWSHEQTFKTFSGIKKEEKLDQDEEVLLAQKNHDRGSRVAGKGGLEDS